MCYRCFANIFGQVICWPHLSQVLSLIFIVLVFQGVELNPSTWGFRQGAPQTLATLFILENNLVLYVYFLLALLARHEICFLYTRCLFLVAVISDWFYFLCTDNILTVPIIHLLFISSNTQLMQYVTSNALGVAPYSKQSRNHEIVHFCSQYIYIIMESSISKL